MSKVVYKPVKPSMMKLKSDNAKLRAACIATLDRLSRMTSEQFTLGYDKPLREMLAKVVEDTK